MTGSIMFLMVETRPDIVFVTSVISYFAKNPKSQYTKIVKKILQYLKSSRKCGIIYGNLEKLLVESYLDSNSVGNKKSCQLISDFIFMLNGGPVSWYSKKQATIALSSTKVKYIALILVAKKVV